MCGFLGSATFNTISENTIVSCNERVECRGPDEKIIINNKKFKSNKLFHNLIFNRLSIIDLTKNASQPMYSEEFNTLIMFNGEIFNHKELRKKLEQSKLRFYSSHSDTETLLLGLSYYGLEFLDKINGQFSIFFYDIKNNEYYLIRDRAGQKPLYFSINSNGFYFGSDLLSIKKLSNNHEINEEQIINYINFGTSITPNTFYKNISTVNPGEFVKVSFKDDKFNVEKNKYWQLSNFFDEKKFIEQEFIELFEDSVKKRLESDVPVSNFLSGGLDSTAVIKAIKKDRDDINTFSMVTNSKKYNESDFMEQVVKKYNTNHHYEIIDKDISFEEVKSIITSYDDLIYDPSLIPTFILSNKISKNFKVALSGDGGDELLSGYEHYSNFHKAKRNPEKLVRFLFNFYPVNFGSGNNILKHSSDWRSAFSSYYGDEKLMKLLKIENYASFSDIYLENKKENWKSLMLTDYEFFLNEMMLKKIDRSSMLNSLEIRSPFLDYRLFEYVISHNSLNDNNKYSPKKIIKKYLSPDFDSNFLDRKKMGFSIDIKELVNNNKNEIIETINSSLLVQFVNLSRIKNLLQINTRMNALRVWKIYSMSLYLEKNKN